VQPGAHRVAGELYQGSFPPANVMLPFDAVALCAMELQPPPGTVRAPLVLYTPLDDGPVIHERDQRYARRTAAELAKVLHRGGRCLVTCAQGRNRSGLVSALTLITLGWKADDAIKAVRDARENALSNPVFVDYLRRCGSRANAVQPAR
jgi:protein-tyrosine phosphatase